MLKYISVSLYYKLLWQLYCIFDVIINIFMILYNNLKHKFIIYFNATHLLHVSGMSIVFIIKNKNNKENIDKCQY